MSDLLKKGFMIGLGAALNGKEKAEKMVDELISKGQMTPGEAKEVMAQFREKGEQQNQKWNDQSQDYLRNVIKDLGFVTKEEHEALELRLQQLENKE